eukprot:gnl/TRDRNA2_/TRDRNA2_169480_c0_seq1.p1 gnl/TRDRNA2_/TRDRNA2_169480_c0~~gnl/TRDRNA2_/TRDRNA2_169480_c0_seq1.p1  ORF type:complete len:1315 (-),score=287.13 gnl/TRDRNA2_/TRDRNA2_169480_c0_seq1:265-3726(-)
MPDDLVVGRLGGGNLVNQMSNIHDMVLHGIGNLLQDKAGEEDAKAEVEKNLIDPEDYDKPVYRPRKKFKLQINVESGDKRKLDTEPIKKGMMGWTHKAGEGYYSQQTIIDVPFFLIGETLVRRDWEFHGNRPMTLRVFGDATLYVAAQCPPLGNTTRKDSVRKALWLDGQIPTWPPDELPVVATGFHDLWRGDSGFGEFRRVEGFSIFVDMNNIEMPLYKLVLASPPEDEEFVDVVLWWRFKVGCEALIVAVRKGQVHCKEEDWPIVEFNNEIKGLMPLRDYSGLYMRFGVSLLLIAGLFTLLCRLWILPERRAPWFEICLMVLAITPAIMAVNVISIDVKTIQEVLSAPTTMQAESQGHHINVDQRSINASLAHAAASRLGKIKQSFQRASLVSLGGPVDDARRPRTTTFHHGVDDDKALQATLAAESANDEPTTGVAKELSRHISSGLVRGAAAIDRLKSKASTSSQQNELDASERSNASSTRRDGSAPSMVDEEAPAEPPEPPQEAAGVLRSNGRGGMSPSKGLTGAAVQTRQIAMARARAEEAAADGSRPFQVGATDAHSTPSSSADVLPAAQTPKADRRRSASAPPGPPPPGDEGISGFADCCTGPQMSFSRELISAVPPGLDLFIEPDVRPNARVSRQSRKSLMEKDEKTDGDMARMDNIEFDRGDTMAMDETTTDPKEAMRLSLQRVVVDPEDLSEAEDVLFDATASNGYRRTSMASAQPNDMPGKAALNSRDSSMKRLGSFLKPVDIDRSLDTLNTSHGTRTRRSRSSSVQKKLVFWTAVFKSCTLFSLTCAVLSPWEWINWAESSAAALSSMGDSDEPAAVHTEPSSAGAGSNGLAWTTWEVSWPPFFSPSAAALKEQLLLVASGGVVRAFSTSSSPLRVSDAHHALLLPSVARGMALLPEGRVFAAGDAGGYEVYDAYQEEAGAEGSPSTVEGNDTLAVPSSATGSQGPLELVGIADAVRPAKTGPMLALPEELVPITAAAVLEVRGSIVVVVASAGAAGGVHLCAEEPAVEGVQFLQQQRRLRLLARLEPEGFPQLLNNVSALHACITGVCAPEEPVLWAAVAGESPAIAAIGLSSGRLKGRFASPFMSRALQESAHGGGDMLTGNSTHLVAVGVVGGTKKSASVLSVPYPDLPDDGSAIEL